jgi:hypothetical protein
VQVERFRAFRLAVITSMLMSSLVLVAQGVDAAAIQARLNSQFKLTTTTADRSNIVTPGGVIEMHKQGMMIYSVASPLPPSSTYKNGKIGQGWGGFGKDLAITMMAPGGATSASYPQAKFAVGDKCWVTGVKVLNDAVIFQLYSDPINDTRYYGNLKIPFPNKKEMQSPDAVLQLVAEVLTAVPTGDQPAPDAGSQLVPRHAENPAESQQQAFVTGKYRLTSNGAELIFVSSTSAILLAPGAAQSRGSYSVNGNSLTLIVNGNSFNYRIQADRLVADNGEEWLRKGGAPAPAAETASAQEISATPPVAQHMYEDIAPPPPPPPPPAPAPSISMGQSKDQVTAVFGEPQRKATVGAKTIFFYTDLKMKVTFTNGKVSNVD